MWYYDVDVDGDGDGDGDGDADADADGDGDGAAAAAGVGAGAGAGSISCDSVFFSLPSENNTLVCSTELRSPRVPHEACDTDAESIR